MFIEKKPTYADGKRFYGVIRFAFLRVIIIFSCACLKWPNHDTHKFLLKFFIIIYIFYFTGVPRQKRGEIWLYLREINQQSSQITFNPSDSFPNYNTSYQDLLKSFTEHQHAIFIDLGRTFPNHKFYKQSLGVGQLSLFNLLKAYSILDPELGYCQGLGFICGVLLLHVRF